MRIFRKKPIEYLNLIASHILFYPYAILHQLKPYKSLKLHVGCGKNHFKGWINADIHPKADLIVFLQNKLPLKNASLEKIYSEHVLEHVPYKTGVFFLKEAYRTLKHEGVIRIAMPDLDDIIDAYQNDWKRLVWPNWPEYSFIKTKAEMLNIAFHWWGHQHLYNREELERALKEAGFSQYKFLRNGVSEIEDFRNLETRIDSTLIVEATKIL